MGGRRRIALFGGSFDPPHLGHVLCATWAHAVGGVDEVWVEPVADHPYGKNLTAWDVRWAMCAAAFADLGFVHLRDDERRNDGGRTVTLVAGLAAQYPDVDWCLIGGTDTERDLANWYRGPDLLAMVEVIAVPRRGYDDDHPAALPAISSTLVRETAGTGRPVTELVPAPVAALISNHRLYQREADSDQLA